MAWELFRRDAADGFEMVSIDGDLLDAAPIDSLPIAVEVSVTAPSTHPDVMGATEVAIESAVSHLGGRIAGTIRSESNLWTLVHVPSDEQASLLSEIPLPSRASIWVQPAVDPDWLIFRRLRPEGIETQSMFDLGVMAELHRAGDRGGPRRIEHTVAELAPDRANSFLRAATTVLVDAEVSADADAGRVEISHVADPVGITPDAWTIRQIAERHGAVYGGWKCEVTGVGDRPERRRWFRR